MQATASTTKHKEHDIMTNTQIDRETLIAAIPREFLPGTLSIDSGGGIQIATGIVERCDCPNGAQRTTIPTSSGVDGPMDRDIWTIDRYGDIEQAWSRQMGCCGSWEDIASTRVAILDDDDADAAVIGRVIEACRRIQEEVANDRADIRAEGTVAVEATLDAWLAALVNGEEPEYATVGDDQPGVWVDAAHGIAAAWMTSRLPDGVEGVESRYHTLTAAELEKIGEYL